MGKARLFLTAHPHDHSRLLFVGHSVENSLRHFRPASGESPQLSVGVSVYGVHVRRPGEARAETVCRVNLQTSRFSGASVLFQVG
ncbi:hypothetical protein GMOD_00001773 [Pyrenophora seminiperda CCB06]|uniref:Uncharacterized protein n=1 Tax=Pyrenophora seminiperda CCB06 TaxID=1302712 RepID=A0A3M7LW22_9PLEO|nr:hypothetical protein GMOD_00001773 [Pyrenophora seminiperda CCB06]